MKNLKGLLWYLTYGEFKPAPGRSESFYSYYSRCHNAGFFFSYNQGSFAALGYKNRVLDLLNKYFVEQYKP